jgi:hypothetical protein
MLNTHRKQAIGIEVKCFAVQINGVNVDLRGAFDGVKNLRNR